MAVVNISATRPSPQGEDQLAQLAGEMSRRLTRVPLDGIAGAIAEALTDIGAVTRVATCRLLEFTDEAAVARVHSASVVSRVSTGSQPAEPEDWLVQRLWRGELVSIARAED